MFHPIIVGDTVAYSESFLDRQHLCPSDLRDARGRVNALRRLDSGVILGDIEWNNRGLPKRVNVKNLIKIYAAAFGK